MSTVLTLTPYRRRSPRRNRGIPTICVRSFGGWRANVSAVDTWLCGEWVRQGLGGASRFSHLGGKPTGPCLAASGACAGAPEVMVRRRSEPGPLQSGLLHEGGRVLVGGCAHCTNPRTLWSTPDPLPVDPDPRAVRVVSGLIVGLRL